jgi:hypothetical protein
LIFLDYFEELWPTTAPQPAALRMTDVTSNVPEEPWLNHPSTLRFLRILMKMLRSAGSAECPEQEAFSGSARPERG